MKANVIALSSVDQRMPDARPSFFVPLNRLVLADDQIRKTPPSPAGIAEMAAMLLAEGQLSALQVSKAPGSDLYRVHAGGRRWRGLQLLVQQAKIAPDFAVECKELETQDGTAVGLMENISQEPMHPADAFEAFQALADRGHSLESIAQRHGVPVLQVRRRLKLAALAPELMARYRKGELQLDEVMALVQLEDPKRQVLLFKSLPPHARSAHSIRRLIAQDEVAANDARVKLVGLQNYIAAGGGVRSDLFSEENARYLTDPLLLDMLVGEAFEARAARLRTQGWKWIAIHPDYGYNERQQYFSLPTALQAESPAQQERRLALQTQVNALQEQLDSCEDTEALDALQNQLDALEQQLQELAAQRIDPAGLPKDLAGVVLTMDKGKIVQIDNLGRVSERKQVLAALAARQHASDSAPDSAQSEDDPARAEAAADAARPAESVETLSERLMLNLTAQRSAAIQACMVAKPRIALAALAQRMASSVFRHGGDEGPIQIRRSDAWHALGKASPTVGSSRAASVLAEERARWDALLPQDRTSWLQWFVEQPQEVSLSMIVLGTAETVQAMRGRLADRDRAADLAQALALDMAQWWEPTAENYLDWVPKSLLIAAVSEAKNAEWAKDMPKLKKAEALAFASEALAGSGWLPPPLRAP